MSTPKTKTIHTKALARVEGEGAMYVRIAGREVEEVKLNIYEPPRFFEAFLRGRGFKPERWPWNRTRPPPISH